MTQKTTTKDYLCDACGKEITLSEISSALDSTTWGMWDRVRDSVSLHICKKCTATIGKNKMRGVLLKALRAAVEGDSDVSN